MAPPSLRLRTFGGLAVERDGVPLAGIAARRRPLVLLAYVASHGDVGVSRDAACALLWPESDEERARNSLKQAVFALRRELGAEVLVTVATTLRVDRSLIAVDVLDFAEALDRDDLATAEALYRGPFFEHGTIAGLDTLERWVSGERERMARAAAQLFEGLAARLAAAGDAEGAVIAWRRRAALDPLSTRATEGLMCALRDAGDRTAALEQFRVHAMLVRDQLESEPDPTLSELAAQIRASLTPSTAMRAISASIREAAPASAPATLPGEAAVAQAPTGEGAVARPAGPAAEPAAEPAALPDLPEFLRGDGVGPPVEWPLPPERPWWQVRQSFLFRALLALCIAALAPLSLWQHGNRVDASEAVGSAMLVAVLPFTEGGAEQDARASRMGRGIADLVSVALHGAGEWQAVPSSALMADEALRRTTTVDASTARAIARRFGAGRYVLGDVVVDGARVHLSASLHGARGEVLAQANATANVGRLDEAAERLVIGLLERQLSAPADRVARVAVRSAASLAALKAWLAGDALYRDHHYGEAVAAFEEAERRDPGFALAYYRHASAADLLGDGAAADSATARAVRHMDGLPDAERVLLLAWRDARLGAVERAEARYEALTDDLPDHPEAWFRLGELQFHANPARGRSVTDARVAFERALAADPSHGQALMYLARIAALEGRLGHADSLVARARAASAGGRVMGLHAARTFAVAERLLQGRALRTLERAGDGDASAALGLAVYHDDVDGTLTFARALRAAGASRELRSLAFRLEVLASAAGGQVAAAGSALDSLATLDGFAAHRLRAMLATHPLLARAAPETPRELASRLLPDGAADCRHDAPRTRAAPLLARAPRRRRSRRRGAGRGGERAHGAGLPDPARSRGAGPRGQSLRARRAAGRPAGGGAAPARGRARGRAAGPGGSARRHRRRRPVPARRAAAPARARRRGGGLVPVDGRAGDARAALARAGAAAAGGAGHTARRPRGCAAALPPLPRALGALRSTAAADRGGRTDARRRSGTPQRAAGAALGTARRHRLTRASCAPGRRAARP
jgi:DNA-binding SARP family transcriptional activator/tetratricopeptide (TPR) repeat protein